jgi:hypothetical protein
VKVHIDQHAVLQGLVAHGYSGIDERSKVRHLVNGIMTPAMDPVKTRIMSDAALRNDFEACVNLFHDYIHQSGAALKNVHVAAVSHKPQGGGRGGNNNSNNKLDEAEADLSIPERFYTKEEYSQLTNAQKLGLKLKHKKRSPNNRDKSKKTKVGPATLNKASTKAFASKLHQLQSQADTEDDILKLMKKPATNPRKLDSLPIETILPSGARNDARMVASALGDMMGELVCHQLGQG